MTWVGLVPGIPLLIAGWILSKRRCRGTSTGNTLTVLGWVLTAGGILCMVAGFALMMF
jgi:hypothetical protein